MPETPDLSPEQQQLLAQLNAIPPYALPEQQQLLAQVKGHRDRKWDGVDPSAFTLAQLQEIAESDARNDACRARDAAAAAASAASEAAAQAAKDVALIAVRARTHDAKEDHYAAHGDSLKVLKKLEALGEDGLVRAIEFRREAFEFLNELSHRAALEAATIKRTAEAPRTAGRRALDAEAQARLGALR